MGLMDALKGMVGAGGAPVELAEPPADGDAVASVLPLIAEIRSELSPQTRDASRGAYLEAVLTTAQVDPCCALLTAALGEPSKPFGRSPAFDADLQAMVDSRGGIARNQCLFLRRHADGRVAFAALWPWSNGKSVTLKLGVYADGVTPGLGDASA